MHLIFVANIAILVSTFYRWPAADLSVFNYVEDIIYVGYVLKVPPVSYFYT